MYLRFIAPGWEVRRGVDRGLFGPAYHHARDAETPEGIARALWHEVHWFGTSCRCGGVAPARCDRSGAG